MRLTNTATRYGLGPQLLHWLVVVLVAVQFLLAEAVEEANAGAERLATLGWHRSIGLTILLLAVIRIAWRFLDRPPPSPPQPEWLEGTAALTHWGLYVLLFTLPLTGWMNSSSAGDAVSWFGLVELPGLVGASESLHESLGEVHETLATLLLVLAGVHVIGALKHQFIDRDGLISRMLPWGGRR
jgi:cytochrome b561